MKNLIFAALALALLAGVFFAADSAEGRRGGDGAPLMGARSGDGGELRAQNGAERGGEDGPRIIMWQNGTQTNGKVRNGTMMNRTGGAWNGTRPDEERAMNRTQTMNKANQNVNGITKECREKENDDEKMKCAKQKLNDTKSAKELVEDCKARIRQNGTINATNAPSSTNASGAANASMGIGACVSEVRSNRMEAVKFRFDMLSDKAEKLSQYGVSKQTISDFQAQIEALKTKFDASETADAKKAVVKETEQAWKDFVAKARQDARAAKEAQDAENGNRTEG